MDPRIDDWKSPNPAAQILKSPEFGRLVAKRWSISVLLSLVLFVLYYGYILLIGYRKDLLATVIGEHTTLGIPIGVGVIALSWVLTVVYVIWANRSYDPEVAKLRDRLTK